MEGIDGYSDPSGNSNSGVGKDETLDPTDFLETGSFDPDNAEEEEAVAVAAPSESIDIANKTTTEDNNSPQDPTAVSESSKKVNDSRLELKKE